MDDEQYKNKLYYQNRKVSSVGNAWIICHSKSYPGRVYYFNTLNGETAWNLSDEETEKAKRTTEILQRQPGANFRKCPEPTDHPPMECVQKSAPSKIYNKQIINNQIPHTAPYHSPCAPMNPLNPLGMSSFNSFNPFIWAQAPSAPHTPILLVPLINQMERTVHNDNLQQSFSEQCSMSFRNNMKRINTARNPNRGRKRFNASYNKSVGRGRGTFVQNDLRQILLAKKNPTEAHFEENILGGSSVLAADTFEDKCNKPEETNWVFEKESTQESSSRLDLKQLRDLADSNAKLDRWYIVADAEVLLNNFPFLNTLTDSDAQCYLMVPQHVMSEIQCYALLSENVHARRIIRFLSQQIEAGCAFIDEQSTETGENENSSAFNTCLKLAKDNYHVVLISNITKTSEYKKNPYNINVFSIQEVKDLVTKEPRKLAISSQSSSTFGDLKRVMSNERNKSTDKISSIEYTPTVNKGNGKQNDIVIIQNHSKSVEVIQSNATSILSKPTVNTAFQVNFTVPDTLPDHTHVSLPRVEEFSCKKIAGGFGGTESEKSTNLTDDLPSHNKTCKSRKLKLQRSISNKTVANRIPEKKTFKWRSKRKDTTNSSDEPKLLSIGSTSELDENNLKKQPTYEEINQKNNVESSESSVFNHKNVSENIVIEETSSSGAISNTASNVDSKSVFSLDQPGYTLRTTKVMFEVTDESMEEHLKMRCDEWISRFVQIMEEVLREILQQDPPFQNIDLPPPWTLHEATRCIIKKFTNDYHVVDAANNLSLVLFINSDNKGNIDKNMEPSNFMEMYSYAVYLVNTLQNVAINCEDLQTAADSLKKLLFDIQNPNMDTSNNDTFADDPPDPSVTLTERTNIERNCDEVRQDDFPININNVDTDSRREQTETRILQSKTRKIFQEHTESQKHQPSNENKLFTSLELQKKNDCTNNEKIKEHQVNDDSIRDSPSENDIVKKKNSNANDSDSEIPSGTINTPAFIRNFTKFADFEERLKNTSKKYYDLDDDFSLDYAEDFEYSSEEYFSDDYYGNKENILENEVFQERHDHIAKDKIDNENQCTVNSADGNKQIRLCIGIFLLEIQDAFTKTHTLCENYFKELSRPEQSQVMRQVLEEKIKKAYLHIDNIYKILGSILVRELSDPENSIQNLLQNSNVVNFVLDDELCVEYRNIVVKCKDQAFNLLSTIDYIKTVAENMK